MKIFQNDTAKIYLADCLIALNDIQNESIDLIFADPPYNIGKRFGNFVDHGLLIKIMRNGVTNGLNYVLKN